MPQFTKYYKITFIGEKESNLSRGITADEIGNCLLDATGYPIGCDIEVLELTDSYLMPTADYWFISYEYEINRLSLEKRTGLVLNTKNGFFVSHAHPAIWAAQYLAKYKAAEAEMNKTGSLPEQIYYETVVKIYSATVITEKQYKEIEQLGIFLR